MTQREQPGESSLVDGVCELTLETSDRSLYCEDPAGNVVGLWDFFQSGDGASGGVAALVSDG